MFEKFVKGLLPLALTVTIVCQGIPVTALAEATGGYAFAEEVGGKTAS